MFAMFRNLFAAFAALFSAAGRLANAADHAAAFVEGEASGFNERTSLQRIQELKKLRSQFTVEDYRMVAEEAAAAKSLDKTHQERLLKNTKPNKSAETAAA